MTSDDEDEVVDVPIPGTSSQVSKINQFAREPKSRTDLTIRNIQQLDDNKLVNAANFMDSFHKEHKYRPFILSHELISGLTNPEMAHALNAIPPVAEVSTYFIHFCT